MKGALFFDFDGVVLDSVNVKTNAFYEMYLPYGKEIAKRVKQYHLRHGGVSRFKKFQHYEEDLLGRKTDEALLKKLGKQFSELVLDQVLASAFIPGVLDFIEKYRNQYGCYIVSGTPEDELKIILKKKKMCELFDGFFGSPLQKTEILEMIFLQKKYDAVQCYYFGDAETDLVAAHTFNVPFILVRSPDNLRLVSKSEKVIDNFIGLEINI